MLERSQVVDLRTRSTYQPDCASLARNRLVMTRNSLGYTHGEFAALLTQIVGWPVSPEAVEAWETTVVPPGDVLIAATTVTPAPADRLGVRSHKFIAAYIGTDAVKRLAGNAVGGASPGLDSRSLPVEHPTGACQLHLWPFGVAVFHLVEDLDLPDIANLALWRYRSYEANLSWATDYLRSATGLGDVAASYVLSLYWLHSPPWSGRVLDTAVRLMCAPRILVDRDTDSDDCLPLAQQAERSLLAEGFDHQELRGFGLNGVSIGYASWSGVAYHPIDPARSLTEYELVTCELAVQSMWAYCEHINGRVEQGEDPSVADGFGWNFLRAARSRLANPRPQETGQHRSMRDTILETSGLMGHLQQATETLRETGTK